MSIPNTLGDIITKVRRVTARPSSAQISDQEIIRYVNTFYIYDMPEHLKMESLRSNYQFITTPNTPVYDFPTDLYLTVMPPVFIAGYQSYMTQSRENFFRINSTLNFMQQSIYTGNGTAGPYTGQLLTNLPIIPGFKPNPPGAYSATPVQARFLNWNVLVTGQGAAAATTGIQPYYTLVDDGLGHLVSPFDPAATPIVRGTINYITGALAITGFVTNDASQTSSIIPSGNPINVQYIPYVASRPQSVVFYQDQIILYPVPDQAYTVSFEVYKYPASFTIDAQGNFNASLTPQLQEWWQLLAYGAADKIFADNADFENMQKYRPLLEEQMNLVLRRTISQQTSDRTATIYTEQSQFPSYPFGNLFSGS